MLFSIYDTAEWLLFFMIYCFVGWIWESCYSSCVEGIRNKKFRFINRGFLNGPYIPIYGFCGVLIVLATSFVRDNNYLIFIVGAITATLFELVAGTLLEKIFHVKYWDYSECPLNYHGHICLFVSVFWGFLSVLLMKFIHPAVEGFVLGLNDTVVDIVVIVIAVIMSFDLNESLHEALDTKEILEKMSSYKEYVNKIEARINSLKVEGLAAKVKEIKHKVNADKANLTEKIENYRENSITWLKELIDIVENHSIFGKDRKEITDTLRKHEKNVVEINHRQYRRVNRHIKRTTGGFSKKYSSEEDGVQDT